MKMKITLLVLAFFAPTLAFAESVMWSNPIPANGAIQSVFPFGYQFETSSDATTTKIGGFPSSVTLSLFQNVTPAFLCLRICSDIPCTIQYASSTLWVSQKAYSPNWEDATPITFSFSDSLYIPAGTSFRMLGQYLGWNNAYFGSLNSGVVGEMKGNAVAVSVSSLSEPTETENDGNQDTKGVADLTKFTFKTTLTGTTTPATWVKLIVLGGANGTSTLNIAPGAKTTYSVVKTFPKGKYTYYFTAKSGAKILTSVKKDFMTGYSNVAFLPGLEASRLRRIDTNVRIWEPEIVHDNTQLYLDANGISKNKYVVVDGVIDTAFNIPIKGNIYLSFISWLTALVNQKVVNDAKIFPYDWRYRVEDIVSKPIRTGGESYMLTTEIQNLAATSDTGKVTIIAHSNGGLVTKALTVKLGTATSSKLIDQIIFVAVPQAGTPKAIGAILHGFDQALPLDSIQTSITKTEARKLAINMPASYGLLPSASYFSYVTDPVITFSPSLDLWYQKYGLTINTGVGLQKFMIDSARPAFSVSNALNQPAISNATLYSKAITTHTTQDVWVPPTGVQLTEIAGWGIETVKTIAYSTDSLGRLIYTPKMAIDGDGTVVVPSALWTKLSTGTKKYWVDLKKYNKDHPTDSLLLGRKHSDILEVPLLRTFIQNTIIRSTASLPTYLSTSTPPNTFVTDKRLHFILHSPLTLSIYDEKGNHTGVSDTGEIIQNIPGSYYETFGEVQYISVPADTDLKLLMKGYKKGTFTLEIEEAIGDTVLSNSKFSGIPSNEKTIVTMDIPKAKKEEGQTLPSSKSTSGQGTKALITTNTLTVSLNLSIDMDGNGKRKMNLKMKKNEMVAMDKEMVKTFAKDLKDAKTEEDKENTGN